MARSDKAGTHAVFEHGSPVQLARRIALLFLFGFLAATVLNAAVQLLPKQTIKRNVFSTISQSNYAAHPFFEGILLDHWTECVHATTGFWAPALEDEEPKDVRSSLAASVRNPMLGNCLQVKSGRGAVDHHRYWHGAVILVKPVLSFAGLPAVRTMVLVVFAVAMLVCAHAVRSAVGCLPATSILAGVLAAPLYSQYLVAPHASNWILGFLFAAYLLRMKNAMTGRLVPVFVVLGILVAYFDLLTNPVVAPTVALIGLTIRRWADGRGADLFEAIQLAIVWVFAYLSFWSLKWLQAALVVGFSDVWHIVSIKARERLYGDVKGTPPDAWTSLQVNAEHMALCAIIGVVVLAASFAGVRLGRLGAGSRRASQTATTGLAVQFAGVGLLPVLWLAVVQNHSIEHFWMVAPILCWTVVGIVISGQVILLRSSQKTPNR